jgi:hypothetical protein
MRISFVYLILILLSQQTWAKTVPATHKSLENLMVDIRDPFFKSDSRKKYLQVVQTKMKQKLAKELNTTTDKLSKAFIDDPTRMDLLWGTGWIQLQTEFYTTLHQETLYNRWVTKTKDKKITAYGKNISDSMIFHLGKYSGVKEGQYYNKWNDISVTKAGKKKNYRVPSFVFGSDTNALLGFEPHTSYKYLFPKEAKASLGNPSLSTFLKNAGDKSQEEYQTLAEKIQLNHRIYIRAVANAAKTVASIHYLTGEYSLTQTELKVSAFIDGFCDGCSQKEKDDYKASAISYVTKTEKSFSQKFKGSVDVVTSFCNDLKSNFYIFDEPPKEEPVLPYGKVYIAVQDNTRVDQSHVHAKMTVHKINALRKTIQEHDLGILFLTNTLTQLTSDRQPFGTFLGCRPDTLTSDTKAIGKAIVEARKNVEQYISQINQKIRTSTVSLKSATETLEYFTQTNVSATSEAVMTFPLGINHVVDSMYQLDRDVKRRKRIDKAVAWGGTIIGVALTVSGIGAPEGVALLLAVGAMAKGVIAGSYHLYRSQEERAFYRELVSAKVGLGNNFYLGENLQKHYSDYRNLRISYIMDFAGAILSFAHIHKMALTRTSGNVPKAHSLIRKCMDTLKASGQDIAQDQLAETILTSVSL